MSRYDESSIKVLKGLDAIRKKPSLYIGPVDSHGIFTLVREVMDNCVDEFYADRNDGMIIDINKRTVTVHDNGQGIPVGEHATEGVSTLELVVSQIHAGGKLDSNDAYTNSRGTHGVGVSAVNALSSEFKVYTNRRNKWWTIGYECGVKTEDFRQATKSEIKELAVYDQGTIVQFTPDTSIFDKGSRLDVKLIHEWAETTAYLSAGFNITVSHKGEETEYQFDDGILEWIDNSLENLKCSTLNSDPIQIFNDNVDICLSFTDADGDLLEGYTNGLYQVDGGIHLSTLKSTIYKTLQPYANKKEQFTREDICEGLLGLVNFKVSSPRFSSQTKEKLADTRFDELCKNDIEKELAVYWKKNQKIARQICTRASTLRGAKDKFVIEKKALQALKKKQRETNKLPTKLSAVSGIKPHERELMLCEGESASGSARSARMDKPFRYQEVLGLKGKIANAYKSKPAKLISSEEVVNILSAIGFDPSLKDPLKGLRIGKLILLSDADPDGMHINSLVLSLIALVVPQMLDRGMVYVIKGPKYFLNHNGKFYFSQTLDEMKKQIPKNVPIDRASYLKGWGEISAAALREVAFNPKTRRLIKIDRPDVEQLDEFRLLMGDDVSYRRKLLGIS